MAVVASSPEFGSHSDGDSGFVASNPLDQRFLIPFSVTGGAVQTPNPLHVVFAQNQQMPSGHQQSTSWGQQSWDQQMAVMDSPTSNKLAEFETHKSHSGKGSGFVASNALDQRFLIPHSVNGGAIQTPNPLHAVFAQNQQTPSGHQQSSSWDHQMAVLNSRTSLDQLTEMEKYISRWLPYYVNHNEEGLIKQFETQFKVYEKVAVMKEVEETRQRHTVSWESRLVPESKTVIVHDEVEHIELVPVVKDRINMKPEIYYHVVEEEIEVPVTEQVLSYEENRVTRQEPRIVAEEVEEMFKVPVVKQVPRTRTKKIITEEYDDILVSEYENPGEYNNSESPERRTGVEC